MTKKVFYLIIAASLSISSIKAQTTQGQEFWLTFGMYANLATPPVISALNMQIRIVAGNLPTSVTIYFTNLDEEVSFPVNAYEVYTYYLTNPQKLAVYNFTTGMTTDYSIHISSTEQVSVYAFMGGGGQFDATNVLPVTALGTEYYHCSYTPPQSDYMGDFMDAYAVVAIQDNTQIWHNGASIGAPLQAGQVYYCASIDDMTGSLITANNPVAFFAVHQRVRIPNDSGIGAWSILMQQLAPIKTCSSSADTTKVLTSVFGNILSPKKFPSETMC